MLWLLEPETLRRLEHAQANFRDLDAVTRWEAAQAAAEAAETSDGLPRGMRLDGSTATISVDGVLTKRPDFWATFFGGTNTTYASIRNALQYAANAPPAQVSEIVFSIDSPGGSADGLVELLDAISNVRQYGGKKMRTRAENALSAAYGIAAAVGNIQATGRGATFGSIGTAVSFWVSPNVVTLTNTDSPDKRPDVTTPEGKATVVRYLDQLNHEFVTAIATGRGVSLQQVTEGYGRGASMTATEAQRLGLIDSIATTPPRAVPTNQGKQMAERDPESADRAALEAATQRGVMQERDRVLQHLTMGEGCGEIGIALEAIRSGASMTGELSARYMVAGMNRAARGTRQGESDAAEAQLARVNGGASPEAEGDFGDQVLASYRRLRGEGSFVRG